MAATIYGFRGCDTVRKSITWLETKGIAHTFVDYRKTPLDPEVLDDWFARAGWEAVFNRNSTTFKEMPASDKVQIDVARARQLILAETNLIKRPVLDTGRELLFGFKSEAWARALEL